jgi:hypothetical protein
MLLSKFLIKELKCTLKIIQANIAFELCILGDLSSDVLPSEVQYADTDGEEEGRGHGRHDHTDHLDEQGRHMKSH